MSMYVIVFDAFVEE